MADFVQTMKDWKRMCNAMGQEDEYTACDKCDLGSFGCPAIYENECNNADWNHVESVVTSWAAEHPEPVYPTWVEWLHTTSAVDGTLDIPVGDGAIFRMAIKNEPIPAELAEKLGIEPKEG